MTVYLAGPITGDAGYRMKFAAVAHKVENADSGISVLNPAILPEGLHRVEYMSICLPMLLRADAVFLLPGWRSSGGARIEKELADYLRIHTVEISRADLDKAMEALKK